MTINIIRDIFLWCAVINMGLFFISFVIFISAHNWIHRIHGKWYNISKEKFDAIYYSMMVFYKVSILFFNIVPYVALCIVG